ncbi:hypothetical protein ZWY2020_013907 [Hordeum vulgare]|nr:hypothetical protein ZWY2020_013907 [Hordeum vulgare]
MAGSHNDINMLQRSPVFARLAEGNSPPVNVNMNRNNYNKGYYLADGNYPRWTTIVKTISNPVGENRKRFAREQESDRKDVERAFGVLQSLWGIVWYPARTWSTKKLWEVMTACVIMHNMIVDDERPDRLHDQGFEFQGDNVVPQHDGEAASFAQFTQFDHEMRDLETHIQLQDDLVEHMCDHVGNQ